MELTLSPSALERSRTARLQREMILENICCNNKGEYLTVLHSVSKLINVFSKRCNLDVLAVSPKGAAGRHPKMKSCFSGLQVCGDGGEC